MQISVVIPVKNRPVVIRRAIESAQAQTLAPVQIIVVDDGSTDETPDVVREMQATDDRIKLVCQPESKGAPTARNLGAAMATGDAIALLDSDDGWKADKLARQAAILKANPDVPAVFCGIEFHYPDKPVERKSVPARVTRKDLYARNVLGGCSGALIRRTSFEAVNGFDPTMPACQDWELWLRLAKLGPLLSDPEPLVEYQFDGSVRISRNRSNVEIGHRRVFDAVTASISDENELRHIRALHAVKFAELYSKQCFDFGLCLRNAWQAVRLDAEPPIIYRAMRASASAAKFALTH